MLVGKVENRLLSFNFEYRIWRQSYGIPCTKTGNQKVSAKNEWKLHAMRIQSRLYQKSLSGIKPWS
jgi:hypothetical protein